jgi:outer membrane protein assembly factor BamB
MSPILLLACALCAEPSADTWPGFRGDGTSTSEGCNVPLTWSPKENVAWRVPLTGYGQSAPVVWKGRVFITAVEGKEKETCVVTALDGANGKQLWRKEFAASQKGKNNPSQSRAAPTPVVDANGVYCFFESGDLVSLAHDGKVRWERSLVKDFGPLKNYHGLGASPAQTEKTVIVLVDHGGPSYLLAVDKVTGKDVWKTDRKGGLSWTSPVVARQGDKEVVVVSSSGTLAAYDAGGGKQMWSVEGLSGNLIPSPAVSGDVVIVGAGESGLTFDMKAAATSNCCVRLNGERVWEGKGVVLHHASPVIHKGHVYLMTKGGVLYCRDLKTGEERYAERLVSACWATPVAVGEHLYCFGKDGVTTVVKAGPEFEQVAVNRLWTAEELKARREKKRSEDQFPPLPVKGKDEMEAMLSDATGDVVYGVAVVDGAIYIRTGTELCCLRKSK